MNYIQLVANFAGLRLLRILLAFRRGDRDKYARTIDYTDLYTIRGFPSGFILML